MADMIESLQMCYNQYVRGKGHHLQFTRPQLVEYQGCDLSKYPDDHSPFCPKSCDDTCHDQYDADAALRQSEKDSAALSLMIGDY